MDAPPPSAPPVTILLPAFDEARSLPVVLEEVGRVLGEAGVRHEVLVVDDGSSDGSGEVAGRLGARVVRHPLRRGAGAAIVTGLLQARGEAVLLMDADATYPAGEIPAMLALLRTHSQVIGARTREAGTAPLLRTPVKWLLRKLGEALVRAPIPDLNSGMRAFRRRDALAFLHLLPDGHSCVSTLTLCFLSMNLPVAFHPIDYRPRIGSSKFHVLKDTARFFVQIVRTITYFAPLRIFLSASFLSFALGTVLSVLDVRRRGGLEESDIILFTLAGTFGMLGLLADLIVRQSRKDVLRDLGAVGPAAAPPTAADPG